MAYYIFRCRCGRPLYAPIGSKTRTCPCGRRIHINKTKILAVSEDARSAGEVVRRLQLPFRDSGEFHRAIKS